MIDWFSVLVWSSEAPMLKSDNTLSIKETVSGDTPLHDGRDKSSVFCTYLHSLFVARLKVTYTLWEHSIERRMINITPKA